MWRICVLLCGILAWACSARPIVPTQFGAICIDPEVGRIHAAAPEAFRTAAADYCARGRPGECAEVVYPCTFSRPQDIFVTSLPLDPTGTGAVAHYVPDHNLIFVYELSNQLRREHEDCDSAKGDTRAWVLAAHELGHALGYSHSLNPFSVMYPEVTCNPYLRNELP